MNKPGGPDRPPGYQVHKNLPMKKTIGILLLLTSISFTGCVKEILVDPDKPITTDEAIGFKVTGNWDDDEIITRTTIGDIESDANGISLFATAEQTSVLTNAHLIHSSGWTYSNTKYWVNGHSYKFFAVYPYDSDAEFTSDNSKVSFDVNEGTTDYLYDAVERNFSSPLWGKTVNLSLKHALSKVTFSVQNDSENETITIKKVKLTGEGKSATCTIDPSGTVFTPTGSSAADYEINYESQPQIVPNGSLDLFSRYVVPQDFSANSVYLEITYPGTNEVINRIDLYNSTSSHKWETNHNYNYVISVGNPIGISVENISNSIYIKNTKTVKAFIRAALVANWYDSSGNVVASSTAPAPSWNITDTDGFYYYGNSISPTEAGQNGTLLISGLSTPSRPSGVPSTATWKLDIIVQGIIDNDASITTAKSAFGVQ